MNIQTLHVVLLILVTVTFVVQVNKRQSSEIVQASQELAYTRAVLEEARRAAEEADRMAVVASQAPIENLEETINDPVSTIEVATNDTKITARSADHERPHPIEQPSQKQKDREMIRMTNPANAPSTLDCDDKDIELIAPSLNVSLTGRCGRVRVGGPNSIVKIEHAEYVRVSGPDSSINIESAESLEVSGTESVVNIGRVDHIRVPAPEAKVYYGGTLTINSNTPKIKISGPDVTVNRR